MGFGAPTRIITVVLFVVAIIVVCATVVPTVYNIRDNTSQLKRQGEFVIWEVRLHEDLQVMIGQLNAFAALLASIDETLDSIEGEVGTSRRELVRELQGKMERLTKVADLLKKKVAENRMERARAPLNVMAQ